MYIIKERKGGSTELAIPNLVLEIKLLTVCDSFMPTLYNKWLRAPRHHHGLLSTCNQCSRLKSSMPFKHVLALQNIPLSTQPFKMQSQIENEDVT